MEDIVDRLEIVTRTFPVAAFYGAGKLTEMLTAACGVGRIIHGDLAAERIVPMRPGVVFDEERLPFAAASIDLVVSLLTLHGVNDLVGALSQWRTALKPDGLLIAALFGEKTLSEFKSALYRAEIEITGGASPRVSPFAAVHDLGAALQRARLAMPVADMDSVEVRYSEPLQLLHDLRGIGETNSLVERGSPLTRGIMARALAEFASAGSETHFDIVYLTGWAPHPDQRPPLQPGTARQSLERAVKHAAPD